VRPRPATGQECDALWPAVDAARLIDTPEELRAYHAAAPWRVRVAGRGEASLLGEWRHHLAVLAMRGVWCSERHVSAFAQDAADTAREHGYRRLLSPLLPVDLLGGYRRVGMHDLPPIVAIQGIPDRMLVAAVPPGIALTEATPADALAVAELDAVCFEEFWRYGADELAELLSRERCTLARAADGEVIGYTLATASRGAAVLSRLCTAPRARRLGVGAALLSEVGRWCRQTGASTIALCTQEENAPSRALYASAGLVEIEQRYGFALREI
jgi:[ribosomal protein S18]-alanine N-acetyltransferase